jgi:hypothetical protein
MTQTTQNTPQTFHDLAIGDQYFTIQAGGIHHCVKISQSHGRKTTGRKGKVTAYPNPNVYPTAEAAQGALDNLLERGRQIQASRQVAFAGGAA